MTNGVSGVILNTYFFKKEADKLNKRLHNLIEMRADGEISRDVFKVKKEEIENRLKHWVLRASVKTPQKFPPLVCHNTGSH